MLTDRPVDFGALAAGIVSNMSETGKEIFMASKTLWVLAAVAFLFSAQSAFADEVWACAYRGEWNTNGSTDKGDFAWAVSWTLAGSNWNVVGDYNDRYGASYLDGSCTGNHCELTQTYNSGSLNGNVYKWVGDYTEKVEDGKLINTFTGTWSTVKGGGSNTGNWTATATCTKVP
jgi:hypothetical protein